MSVEPKKNGQLRLTCDEEGCPHKFVPLRPYTDGGELRKRAALYGWGFAFDRDTCPEHGRQQRRLPL